MTDIEIAQAHEMKKIVDVAAKAGIPRMRPSPRTPFWGASWFLSRPEGRVAALHPPGKGRYAPGENSDNKSKQLIWGA